MMSLRRDESVDDRETALHWCQRLGIASVSEENVAVGGACAETEIGALK